MEGLALGHREIERFVVTVTRGDGSIEVLSPLFHTMAEAQSEAQVYANIYLGVKLQASRCVVTVEIPEVLDA